MKKVFLSLAFVAALTVVSCKQAEAEATEATDSTTVEAPAVEETAAPADSTAAPADSTAAPAEAAPAAEAPAAK